MKTSFAVQTATVPAPAAAGLLGAMAATADATRAPVRIAAEGVARPEIAHGLGGALRRLASRLLPRTAAEPAANAEPDAYVPPMDGRRPVDPTSDATALEAVRNTGWGS